MMSNLIASTAADEDGIEEIWLKEYVQGTGFEIYRVKIEEIDF